MAKTWDSIDASEQQSRARKYARLQGGAQARCEMEARAAGWFGAGRPLLPEASDPSLADESERWIMMPQPERSGPECRPPFWHASRSMPTANTEALGRDEVGPQRRTSSTPAQCYPRICCVRRHAPEVSKQKDPRSAADRPQPRSQCSFSCERHAAVATARSAGSMECSIECSMECAAARAGRPAGKGAGAGGGATFDGMLARMVHGTLDLNLDGMCVRML